MPPRPHRRPPSAASIDGGAEEGWELSLGEAVNFLVRHWKPMALLAGIATICALAVLLLLPPVYEASTLLVTAPPTFSSELIPVNFSQQAYEQLLTAPGVIGELKRRLVEDGVLKPQDTLEVGENLETMVLISRHSDLALSPTLEARASAADAEKAALIANTWARVFLETTDRLVDDVASSTVSFIEAQHPEARQQLEAYEEEKRQLQDRFDQLYHETATEWDRRITAAKQETEDRVASYKEETGRALNDIVFGSVLLQEELPAPEAGEKASLIRSRFLQLLAVREQLAETPRVLGLEKAVPDEVLWENLLQDQESEAGLEALSQGSLRSEEVDPLYAELTSQALQIEADLAEAVPPDAKAELREISTKLLQLQRRRAAGLQQLLQEIDLNLMVLGRQRRDGLAAVKRVREQEVTKTNRQIRKLSDLHQELSEKHNAAVLAKAQNDVEIVRIAAPATPPDHPVDRGLVLKVLVATLLGALLGLAYGVVRELGGVESAGPQELSKAAK